ncbi:MAG: arginine--tRNA ligase [Planctomycetes bacterium]|nr:arginine--tRNA ligase [Planctomycetota bacterium]
MNIVQLIQNRFQDALHSLVADPGPLAAMVRPTQDVKHGDYQANCAMSLGKTLGKKPREVAQEIADGLDLGDELEKPEIAGPGFINLRIRPDWMARQLQAIAEDERLGVSKVAPAKNYVIDFSSPNVAKPMHVGHLRSTIIGDSLTRLLRFLGHTVITDNHLGDWGTQFGMLLYGYKHFVDAKAFEADPVRELARIYLHMRSLMKADEDEEGNKIPDPVAEAARQETAKLHAGDVENVQLWKMFMPACLEEINVIYRRLGVQFDHMHGESFYNDMLPDIVRELEEKGIAERSKGAMVISFGAKEPPALIQKSDGAFTYATSDLATIRYRVKTWNPDAMLYLVGSPQALHFKQLFAAARRWGYGQIELEHIAFGSVLGEDRKPFKTREGGVIELGALLDEAVERAGQVYEQSRKESLERGEEIVDLGSEERRQIEEAVGLGAVKYADLCQNRLTDYVFSWPKMLAMNGNTATYMQYAYVRNRGIFRKGGVDAAKYRNQPPLPKIDNEHERALAVQLLRFEESLLAAATEYQPSAITSYLWDLAKTYSGFFQNCPVLKAESEELRESRLLLCDLTARVIQKCLELLGIRTVERM